MKQRPVLIVASIAATLTLLLILPPEFRAALLAIAALSVLAFRGRFWFQERFNSRSFGEPRPWGSLEPASLAEARLRRRTTRGANHTPQGSLIVLSNREPYIHERDDRGEIVVRRPAGGLVTGLEPLLRASGGTWIAHASGSADLEASGTDGVVAVPPDLPRYVLQRIFLEPALFERYYSGFSNEALWPLCHRVHVKPVFRRGDWKAYLKVNAQFARAATSAGDGSPILVQDYHLALVPRFIRETDPARPVAIFWHIPWPTAEAFAICPWATELLEGLLGADVVGFHTDEYGDHFIDSVSRMLDCEIDLTDRSITYRGHRTRIRTYPISVEWPFPIVSRHDGAQLRAELGIRSRVHISVGVDRADYTKGLLEKIRAVELLLENNPKLAGRYTLVQVVAPSRQTIQPYRDLIDELQREVARVNARFGGAYWRPVVLSVRAVTPREIRRYYAMADSAVVTPLHDGMNLVAKEYVASCEDGKGVLVLSRFAGAAAELEEALLVNPYDIHDVARALERAIGMPAVERARRMRSLRAAVAANTIFDWSANLLSDLHAIHSERTTKVSTEELLRARGA